VKRRNASTALPAGKLAPDMLESLLRRLPTSAPDVLVGPAVGEDAAVLQSTAETLVVSTDPVTFVTDVPAAWLVQINANDIAAMGARPRFLAVTALYPAAGVSPGLVTAMFEELAGVCRALEIVIVGGHTEITPAVNHPVLVGIMLGVAPRDHIHRSADAREGDRILLAGWAAHEGCAIIARERRPETVRLLGESRAAAMAAWADFPNLLIVDAALELAGRPGVHALHDATESGVAGAVREVMRASGCGCVLRQADIPVRPEAVSLCRHFGLDWRGVISSGLLVATVAAEHADAARETLARKGISCTLAGEVTAVDMVLETESGRQEYPDFPVDEITRLFD
jgi:hydrogenase maturation factor